MEPYHIVGAGGIGCAVGYALSAAGCRVIFADIDSEKLRWGQAHGVRVDRRPPRHAEFVPFAEWSAPAGSTVLLCTKGYDNPAVLARLPPEIALVPIQNGFDPALAAFGHAGEGIASFVSECLPHQTHTRITRAGRLHLGLRHANGAAKGTPSAEQRLQRLADLLQRAGLFRVQLVPDIMPYKHTKLMYNAAIGPIAAAAGFDNGQLLSVPRARQLFFALLRENYAILHAAGITLETIGPFHPATVDRILRHRVVARALAWAFYPSLRGSYCSMHGDLPRGRTEIEHYNRYLINLAGPHLCPLNQQVYALIKRMERERIPPSLTVLEPLLAAC